MTDYQQAALEAVKGELDSQEAMHCTRVWEAWRYGTMTEEDFVNVSEDDECVQALVAAAEPHLRKKWAEEEAAKLAKTTVGLAAILDRFLENAEWESSGEEMAQKIIESVQNGLLEGAGE